MASNVATPLERQLSLIQGVCPDDLDTARLGSTNITLQFDLGRNIDAAAQDVQAADQRRRRPAAQQHAEPAGDAEGEPGGQLRPGHRHDLGHPAAEHDQRLRRQHRRPAAVAHARRRPGQYRRRAQAGHPHPHRPAQGGGARPAARRHPPGDHHRHGERAQGPDHRPDADPHRLRRRPGDRRRDLEQRHRRLPQRRADPHRATSAARVLSVENTQGGAMARSARPATRPTTPT